MIDEKREEEQSSNHMEIDKKTVSGQDLKIELVSSGKFFIGDAIQNVRKIKIQKLRLYKNGIVKDHPYSLSCEILEDGLFKRELMILKS